VRTQLPTNYRETDFLSAVASMNTFMDSVLPVWVSFDWYRSGSTPVNVSGGPSGGGFYLDEVPPNRNLDFEVFDV
jgi:hypothetical protein